MPLRKGVTAPAEQVILAPFLLSLLQGLAIPATYFFNIDQTLVIPFLVKLYFVSSQVFPPRHQCGSELVIYHPSPTQDNRKKEFQELIFFSAVH